MYVCVQDRYDNIRFQDMDLTLGYTVILLAKNLFFRYDGRTMHDATLLAEVKDENETEILMNSNLNSNTVVKFNFSLFSHLENGMNSSVNIKQRNKTTS